MDKLDFKIPAKYVMVASTLLRMKSDHLPLFGYLEEDEAVDEMEVTGSSSLEEPALNLLTIPPLRIHKRKIVVAELVAALRKVMGTQSRRELRKAAAKDKIKISQEDMGKRINSLYDRITAILSSVKNKEVPFKDLVPKWTRPEVANTFLPLVYLDHQQKVEVRQEEVFDELYVSKRTKKVVELPEEPAPRKVKRRRTRGS